MTYNSDMAEVTRHLVDLEGYQVINKKTYDRVLWERRLMFGATGLTVVGILFFIISISTCYWARVDIQNPGTNNSIRLHLGIWGEWRTDYNATKHQIAVVWLPHFPNPPEGRPRLNDRDLPHYYRTQAVFSVIALALMLAALFLAIYSFRHHRYMYKRLTAGIMAIIAMCILVVIEVLVHSINEWQALSEGTGATPAPKSNVEFLKKMKYGYSTILAWFVFGIYIIAAVIFLFGGRKQKGLNAATQELEVEDRPINLD